MADEILAQGQLQPNNTWKDKEWSDLAQVLCDITKPGGAKILDCFQTIFGDPTKDTLDKGTQLFKFNNFPSISQYVHPDTRISEWWMPCAPYKHDAGLAQKIQMAKDMKVSLHEWGRITSAIKEDWNSMEYILTIELSDPVVAWFGGYKAMDRKGLCMKSKLIPEHEQRGIGNKLPGGGTQFFIPGIQLKNVRVVSVVKTHDA